MCARFSLTSAEQVERYFQGRLSFEEIPRYNVAPSDTVLCAVVTGDHNMVFEQEKWGLHLGGRPQPVINLRSEGSPAKRAIGERSRFQRCLIPATGFFEWRPENGIKQPYNFALKASEAFAFAGLRQHNQTGPPEFAILTCEPNELVAQYHDRMPAMVDAQHADDWLFGNDQDSLSMAQVPFPAELMQAHPVSRKVGSPRFQDPLCVVPAQPENPSLF